MTEAEKLQKLTESFLCLNEEEKKYTAAMVEALTHACAGLYCGIMSMESQTFTQPGKRKNGEKQVEIIKMNTSL